MLSRVADALYWCARYMERAGNTARILDINHHMLGEPSDPLVRLRWGALIAISGDLERFGRHYGLAGDRNVFEFLAFRDDNPNSIVSCVKMVRENARTIRDRISREMWDEIDSFSEAVLGFRPEEELAAGPRRFCQAVRSGSHRFRGVAGDTLPHDEGWYFLQAGRALERAEMTARIVDVEYHQLVEHPSGAAAAYQWMAVLKSLAAYEMYCRRYHSRIDPAKVAELLILNLHHPRSIRFNIALLESSLRSISGARSSGVNEAERLAGEALETLSGICIQEILERGMHPFLIQFERSCQAMGEHIARSYFYYSVVA